MSFKVFIVDNFHFPDISRLETERYEEGEYESYKDALAICKEIVDTYLTRQYKSGMTAEELYNQYKLGGEDPFITPTPEGVKEFTGWGYAKELCAIICNSAKQNKK
jgi:hypothetical protein